MRAAPTAAVLTLAAALTCVACGSSGPAPTALHHAAPAPSGQQLSSRTEPVPTRSAVRPAADAAQSPFCVQARDIGNQERQSPGKADVPAQLAALDRLDAVAPSEVATDVHLLRQLEHAILEPSAGAQQPPTGEAGPALRRVAVYFHDVCHATYDG